MIPNWIQFVHFYLHNKFDSFHFYSSRASANTLMGWATETWICQIFVFSDLNEYKKKRRKNAATSMWWLSPVNTSGSLSLYNVDLWRHSWLLWNGYRMKNKTESKYRTNKTETSRILALTEELRQTKLTIIETKKIPNFKNNRIPFLFYLRSFLKKIIIFLMII